MSAVATIDPYFQSYVDSAVQVIWSTRPITLAPSTATGDLSSADPTSLLTRGDDGVVHVVLDRDLVVYADQLTLCGTLRLVKDATTATDTSGPSGCRVTILARELLTNGAAVLDVSGGTGLTHPEKDWGVTTPTKGTDGFDRVPNEDQDDVILLGSMADPFSDYEWWQDHGCHAWEGQRFGDPAGEGESSNLPGCDQHDPNSRLNGQPGADGGRGGQGGTVSLRLGHLAINAALTVHASGGRGGDGRKGQTGGTGGEGGKGHDPIDASKDGVPQITPMYPGGRGGRGGKGGKGGAAGKGGDGGQIRICVRSGSADSIALDVSRGVWGAPGKGGDHGNNGGYGFNPPYWRKDPGWLGNTWDQLYADPIALHAIPEDGDDGDDGGVGRHWGLQAVSQPADGTKQVTSNCSAAVLLAGTADASQTASLPCPLSGYLLMLVEQLRADLLMAPYQPPSPEMSDRVAWLIDLLAYQAIDPGEIDLLDAIRGHAQILGSRVKKGLDYFGHHKRFAPLGSMDLFQTGFTRAVDTFTGLQNDYDTLVKQIQNQATRAKQLKDAQSKFQAQASAFQNAAATEEKCFTALVGQIIGSDASEIAAAHGRAKKYTIELDKAISSACGLRFEDFVTAIGQFAFLGEHGPQQAAMVISQAAGLPDTGTTKCVGLDGTKYSKDLLLHQLTEVTNLDEAWTEYKTKGTIGGIQLTDPGGFQLLLGKQSQLDQLCEKLWNMAPAQELKQAFDDFVAAVQQRNADILAYNESVTRWQQDSASAAHARAAAAHAGAELANQDHPGLSSTAGQMAHMVMRAKDDCISELYLACRAYWMWSLQRGDPLSNILTDFSVGEPLPLSPDVLKTAQGQVYLNTTKQINQRLSNPANWIPPNDPNDKGKPGIRVHLTAKTHPRFFEDLISKHRAMLYLPPARKKDEPANPFNGLGDVRIWKVRPWIVGARIHRPSLKNGHNLRVDLRHGGRERIVEPATDTVHVIHHERVHAIFEYDVRKPVPSEEAILADASLKSQDEHDVDAALIGPFTRWEIDISKYNDGLDTSKISEVVLEFFCCVRPF